MFPISHTSNNECALIVMTDNEIYSMVQFTSLLLLLFYGDDKFL